MTTHLMILRCQKIIYCATHPWCWHPAYHGTAPALEHATLLRELEFDVLLDVGANRGQFSLLCRHLKPRTPIHAYEPLRTESAVYRKILGKCTDVHLHECALGSENNAVSMYVSGRADSSSILPIGNLQRELYPATGEVGTEDVRVVPLDSPPEHWSEATRGLLKIDV